MINLLNSGYPSIWRNVYFKLMFKSGNLFFTIVAACTLGVGAFIASGSHANQIDLIYLPPINMIQAKFNKSNS
jgi:hypothetical protein